MKKSFQPIKHVLAYTAVSVMLTACTSTPNRPEGSEQLRSQLIQLQSNPQLASRAAVAIKDADAAVTAAEEPQPDKALSQHLMLIADRKIQIAEARASSRLLEDQRVGLSEQRERARLEARSLEVDSANDMAAKARRETMELQRQVAELNAKATDRGVVVTLGDLQFATGQAELRNQASSHLNKLAEFLRTNKDREVLIEGHTDNVGASQLNNLLSQKRADAVKAYLVSQGINSNRLDTTGMGASSPVADNDSAIGRQQNRRVEIVFLDNKARNE